MSSENQEDVTNLNKDQETTTTVPPDGNAAASSPDETDNCSQKVVDKITPTTSDFKTNTPIYDNLDENSDEIEKIIERKIPNDKEKALDIDSELDFELKWDDDLNDDLSNDIDESVLDSEDKKEDVVPSVEKDLEDSHSSNKEAESTPIAVQKDFDKEINKPSKDRDLVEKNLVGDLDSVYKNIESTLQSMEDADNELESADIGPDSKMIPRNKGFDDINEDVESVLTSIDEGLESASKDTETTVTFLEKNLMNADIEDQSEQTSTDEGLNSLAKDTDTALLSTDNDNKLDCEIVGKIDTNTVDNIEDNNAMDVDTNEESHAKADGELKHTEVLKDQNFENEALTFNVDTRPKTFLETITSPDESESTSLDEQLVYSDAEGPDIDDKDLLDEIDAQIIETDKTNELDVVAAVETQVLLEPSTSKNNTVEDNKCQKESSEMDVDDDLNASPVKAKDPNDTYASITDMETSSYDINNEHRLDRPDVMIEIPTQELIEPFDDSEEETGTVDDNKFINSDDVSNKIDPVENTVANQHSQNVLESHVPKDDVNIEELVSNKDDTSLIGDVDSLANKTKISDTVQVESKEIDTSASEEIKQTPKKLNEENIVVVNTNLEENMPDENITHEEKVTDTTTDIILARSESQKDVSTLDLESKIKEAKDTEQKEESIDKELPSIVPLKGEASEKAAVTEIDNQQPSTSKYHQELSDEDQEETSDSLGLLAESSRVLEDEDEQEQEPEPDDEDDDDDFDQDDESSNQMAADHSEDSNAPHSETDVPKEPMDVDEGTDELEPHAEEPKDAFDVLVDESSGDKDFTEETAVVESEKIEAIIEPEESVEATIEKEKVAATLENVVATTGKSTDVQEAVSVAEDTAKVLAVEPPAQEPSKLRQLLVKDNELLNETEKEHKSPSKTKKLEISKPKHEISIVELEESSSEDDIQVVNKQADPVPPKDVTSVNIPAEVEVMSTSVGESSDMTQREGEVVISGLPRPQAHKPTRLNTDQVTIKTASPAAEPLVIPETTAPKTPEPRTPVDDGEVFNLDSEDEEKNSKSKRKKKLTAAEIDTALERNNKCINSLCTSDPSVPLVPASVSAAVYFAANPQRGGLCTACDRRAMERSQKLIEGVKDLTPYLNMEMCLIREEFVEISDSDSEDEAAVVKKDDEVLGEKSAAFLEEHLAGMFNETWKKYDMEARLLAAETEINLDVVKLEEECKKIDQMLHECQTETDKLRNDLYDTFADERKELPSISIYDTPSNQWCGLEDATPAPPVENKESRQAKRRPAPQPAPPAKRPPIPLGYAPLPETKPTPAPVEAPAPAPEDDNADISVVKLSVESAPVGLPGPGVATRPPLRPNMQVYAMRNTFGAWHRVRIVEVQPKVPGQFTTCRVRFEHPKNITKVLQARNLAYEHAPDVRLTIGTRVVALFKDHRNLEDVEKKEAYYSGIVAEIPNPVNSFRYLIFFDDGYAQYVQHSVTRLVCECAPRVWDEVHPFSRQFVRDYLRAYPERPMVRLHPGQSIKCEWNGKWWPSKVLQVDASLVHVFFEGKKEAGVDKTEWIYRGSTRLAPLYMELQAAERQRARPLPRAQAQRPFNMPYVEYTRSDEAGDKPASPPEQPPRMTAQQTQAQIEQEIRRQRAVAKKSTAAPPPPPARDNVTSRVVFYTPKNAIRPHKMVPHTCGPRCKRTDVLALKDLRTYNPLTKPLLSGWERHQVRFRQPLAKAIMYRAPCGRRIRDYKELHQYLRAIDSDMGVDLFDFNPNTHCLAEFLLNKCLISKKDLSHGKENVPVPCVNYYDDSLPEFCSYNTERTPTAGVPLNLDPEFLCGCDCTDDCADKTKCACWKMTLEGARTIGLDINEVGYVYKRLPEPLPSGIYECNSRCKCKQTCLNRVAQHPLQLKLQVFKTANRGWGIRALNDVPKGAFLCVYAGNLLTDATANLDGLNEGDEYLAELDYIEVVEQMKEGFEEDIPEDAKKADQEETETTSSSSSSDEEPSQEADDDFRPKAPGTYTPSEYSKRLRKREKLKKVKDKEDKARKEKEKDGTDDCITISDDEELREPAHFAAQAGMGGKEFVSKYKSVRTLFGKDEACYIMDAKVQGNIGRYLNHSCTPNVFVQNVFVDTHDPRFPWVAFFALSHIRAGTELTWNYNYDVGSVPGKVLICYCNAPNCRGRLL